MTALTRIHEGLGILLKYEPDGSCSVSRDELYAGGRAPEDMTPEDRARLEDLGWTWDDSHESWSYFT